MLVNDTSDLRQLLADCGISIEAVAVFLGISTAALSQKFRTGALSRFDAIHVARSIVTLMEHRLTSAREALAVLDVDGDEQGSLLDAVEVLA
jgi:hypothetical protein